MRRRFGFPLALAAALAGCVAHTGLEPAADDPGAAGAAPEPAPAAAGDVATATPAPCPFLEAVEPRPMAPGLPRLAPAAGISVGDVRATIRVAAEGQALVGFDIDLSNAGAVPVEAMLGYAFRTGGGRGVTPLGERVTFGEGVDVRSCAAGSGPREHGVYEDEAAYAVVAVGAGQTVRVRGEASFALRRSEAPSTLFGFPDAHALNLKRFPWSYLGDPAYAAMAGSVRPYAGSLDLIPSAALRVIISGEARVNWMRAMSHEQNGAVLRSPGTFGWNFLEGDAPERVSFEYDPDLPVRDEVALFRELAGRRKTDLRALIRLADLQRFGGDQAERVATLEALLGAWEANAEEQLLTGGNDVRGAAWVALVRTLHLLDRKPEAKARAREGLAVVEKADPAAEVNRAAAKWLAKYAGEE